MSAQPPFNSSDSETPAPESASKGGLDSKTWIIIILIILLGAGGSAAGVWFYMSGKSPKTETAASAEHTEEAAADEDEQKDDEEEKSEEESAPVFVNLDPFTVNLQPDGQFLQATFSLEIKDEKNAEQLKVFMPQLRSRMLLMLSGKTAEGLSTQSGKAELIKEIKQLVGQPIKAGQKPIQIEDVHVTAFIIQ